MIVVVVVAQWWWWVVVTVLLAWQNYTRFGRGREGNAFYWHFDEAIGHSSSGESGWHAVQKGRGEGEVIRLRVLIEYS